MSKHTTYSRLEAVALIEDKEARKVAFRKLLEEDNMIAIVVQRVYHPNYNWRLPAGPMPAIAVKSNHYERGPFIQSIRRWDNFRVPEEIPFNYNLKASNVETQFIALYESVASDDADLLIAVKDKKLPWDSLDLDFVMEVVPELFPHSFRTESPEIKTEASSSTTITDNSKTESTGSKKDQCFEIMQSNPGLARKEYIKIFQEKVGIAKATASVYYQDLKDKV